MWSTSSDPVPVPPQDRHRIHNRNGPVVVRHKGRIVVWGGDNGDTRLRTEQLGWNPEDIFFLDTSDNTWYYKKTLAENDDLPRYTCDAASQLVGHRLYILCGSFTDRKSYDLFNSGTPRASNDVYFLDLDTWRWTKLDPAGTRPREGCKMSSWLSGSSIYIFGGIGLDPGSTHNDLAAYDTARNEWWWPQCSGEVPSPRIDHASFVDVNSNRAYVFGGWMTDERRNWLGRCASSDVFMLDMTCSKWQKLRTPRGNYVPCVRRNHTLTLLSPLGPSCSGNATAILYGGTGSSPCFSISFGDCWMLYLDASSNIRWSRRPLLEKGLRSLHAAVAVPESGQLFVVGGCMDYETWSWAKRVLKLPVAVGTTPPSLRQLAMTTLVDEKKRVASAIRGRAPLSVQVLFESVVRLQQEEREEEEEENARVERLRRGELLVCET